MSIYYLVCVMSEQCQYLLYCSVRIQIVSNLGLGLNQLALRLDLLLEINVMITM